MTPHLWPRHVPRWASDLPDPSASVGTAHVHQVHAYRPGSVRMIMSPAEMLPFFVGLVAIFFVGFLLQRRKK